jgi:N-acetylmuramoyl-L-alanine amidase
MIFLTALVIVAGCKSAPHDNSGVPDSEQNAQLIEKPSPDFTPSPAFLTAPLKPIPLVTNPAPLFVATVPRTNFFAAPKTNANFLAAKTNFSAPTKMVHRALPLTFTPLDRWAADNNLKPAVKLTSSPVLTYSISSRNGICVLEVGTREATWRGMSIHLGFAPEMVDGQLHVHGLDITKTLAPLLVDVPPNFAPHKTICLDAGHGGINGGTISALDGRAEKEFTLDWARRLGNLLSASGWTVFYTRTNDLDVSLSNRVAVAESHQTDLFISLHFNSSAPDHRQSGLETYCLTPTGMPSTLTRGYADVWSDIYPNNAHDIANIQLATRLHSVLLPVSSEEDRGIRRARFMGVLLGQRRPAVLIEGGYLSNRNEAERIENGEFRQKLAEAVASALR